MDAMTFAALAEPNRLRIVALLDRRPCAVGEIADRLGLRQPQATKHLQTLVRAGLVSVHPLGQRRIYALEREPLRLLRGWADALSAEQPSEDVLSRYRRAVEAEQAAARRDPGWAAGRRLNLRRRLAARPPEVWKHWTSPELMRTWWAPEHFSVAECVADAVAGGRLRIVLREGDGSRHAASGRFLTLDAPRALSFELAPVGPDGKALFEATHIVALDERPGATQLSLDIHITSSTADAAPMVAGMRIGWEQCLTKLARAVARAEADR